MRNRKRLRLKEYDYSQNGCYYVTIRTKDGINYFGKIADGKMELNNYGKIAENLWKGIPSLYQNIMLDQFVVMPNHIHGIIIIMNENVRNASIKKFVKTKNGTLNISNISNKRIEEMHSIQSNTDRSKMLLSRIIQSYKKTVSVRINNLNKKSGFKTKIWHKSFYDHIIRNEKDFENTQAYICNNPIKWEFERENLNN